MKRKLLKQIANEWRSNLWLTIELLVVSVVMWYATDYLYTKYTIVHIPMGIETDNCFLADFGRVPDGNPNREPTDNSNETMANSLRQIIDRLRTNPDIEEVALVTYHAIPYTQNSNSSRLVEVDSPDSLVTGRCPMREVSPEYATVFRVRGSNGETPEQLADILRRDEWILSDNVFTYDKRLERDTTLTQEYWMKAYANSTKSDKSFLIGKRFFDSFASNYNGDSIPHRIGAIVKAIKRHEYETPNGGLLRPMHESSDNDVLSSQLIIRVHPDKASTFRDRMLRESTTTYRAGNSFISTVTSLDSMRRTVQADNAEHVRNYVVIMLFLMVSIFLGLLGTFWFRTQQRVSEIAIRMVNGATRASVFRRLIGEGILLLAIVTPFATLIDWLLCHYQLNSWVYGWDFFEPTRFTLTIIATFLLMTLMIVLGIWFPASRAMRIEPAVALKDE